MWLKSGALGVFFDEKRGGMPTADSFGFIRAAAVEIAYTMPFPFFQSLNDKRPLIKRYENSKLTTSGIMRKGGEVAPHTYEMKATLEGNRLNLAYRLNVAKTERIIQSKIWVWTKFFQNCTVSGEALRVEGGAPSWHRLYGGEQPRSVVLFDSQGRLEVLGFTTPPVYAEVLNWNHGKMEVVYGWAKDILQKGTYSGELTLIYGG